MRIWQAAIPVRFQTTPCKRPRSFQACIPSSSSKLWVLWAFLAAATLVTCVMVHALDRIFMFLIMGLQHHCLNTLALVQPRQRSEHQTVGLESLQSLDNAR
mmetsp:Transcript_31356/g.57534  ORF Transcript_31356/g.57534 Transcript_31356/m.57534 type:complete len:101 (-) Transcript_31356:8-310(-)